MNSGHKSDCTCDCCLIGRVGELEKVLTDYALLTNDYEELAYEVMELRALVGEKTLALKHADVAHQVGRREIKRCRDEVKALRLTIENMKSECVAGRCDEKTFAISERILAIARSPASGGAES
jgi:hypothetical protein